MRVWGLALVSVACATFPRPPSEGGTPWLEARSRHFVVDTDLDAVAARRFVDQLESWTAAITAVSFLDVAEPKQPLRAIAVRSLGEARKVSDVGNGRYVDRRGVGPLLYIGQRDNAANEQLIKHELVHALLAESMPTMPQWLHEGLAYFLEDIEYDEARREVVWGIVDRERSVAPERCPPASTLTAPSPWPEYTIGLRTRCAGMLVSMLHSQHQNEVACFLQALGKMEESRTSSARCFPDPSTWDAELAAHENRFEWPTWKRKYTAPSVEVAVVPLNPADTFVALAALDYFYIPSQPPPSPAERLHRADSNLTRALAVDPSHVLANGLWRSLHASLPAGTNTAELVRRHPEDWRAWLFHGESPGVTSAERDRVAGTALVLAPHRAEVLELAAVVALTQGRLEEAMAHAREASKLDPDALTPFAVQIVAAEQASRCHDKQRMLSETRAPRRTALDAVARLRKQVHAREGLCPWTIDGATPPVDD